MDKERIVLLRLLAATLLVPVVLFFFITTSKIRSDRELLKRFEEENAVLTEVQREVLLLEEKRTSLEDLLERETEQLFSTEEITYYQFCDFIVESAQNRGLVIQDYTTNEAADPQRITISADGSIRSILNFLHHLYSLDKKVDISNTVISFNTTKGKYNLSMAANFLTDAKHPKE